MNPFSTPERKPQAVHIQVFYKADVIAFIQSMQFDYIELPLGMTTSSDNSDTSTFVRFFCDALADVLVQYAPKESSPKRLLNKMSFLEIDTPTKGPSWSAGNQFPGSPSIALFQKPTTPSMTASGTPQLHT